MKNILLCLLLMGNIAHAQSDHLLWFNRPAEYFEETLVLGNGKMGASVFGGVQVDSMFLNDATLWTGEPVNVNMNPEAHQHVSTIREALKQENYALADSLQRHLQGSFSQSYAPLGTLYLHFRHEGVAENYYRELNIEEAVSTVRYEVNGVRFQREYFISYPDSVMVIRLTCNKSGALNFDLNFNSLLKNTVEVKDKTLSATGYAPIHAEPSYRGNIPNAVIFEEKRGTRFALQVAIRHLGGGLVHTENSIGLKDGSDALILVSIATSFNGFDKNPATEGVDEVAMAAKKLKKAQDTPRAQLRKNHSEDYKHRFFTRVKLSLGETTAPNLPTDERLKRYAEGKEDKNLEILYFQYGRYLLISSSRTPGVPANLQGIWNPYLRPPWSSNYTININAEENYWLAENTNLSEMHEPLLGFIQNIATTGAVTAKNFYGVQDGWVACHNSDIWAMSNPVGDFGKGDPVWANWNMGGTWLSTHLWEHFSFTQDSAWLHSYAYPLLRGAAAFNLHWLVEDKNGKLLTAPSTSPENKYVTPDGYHGATLYGATADLAMIRESFSQTISAAKILNTDTAFRQQLEVALARLHPYQIGKKGNLQEWYHDWEDEDPQHRHQTHLFGLHPGHHISPGETPELAAACRKTLDIKGDETTGWSKGWRINLWARLHDGNRAYKMYRELLRFVPPDGLKTNYQRGGGTYPNLFDAHPPFQVDGNFGGAAAVAEMLLQSNNEEILLLPALPDVWATGKVEGLCARGGWVVSMEWENKVLTKVSLTAKNTGKTTLLSGRKRRVVSLKKGEKVEMIW